ncbi:response regulator [archaeon]|nr:response regulator [archaeon]
MAKKIMIVDDEVAAVHIAKLVLKRHGYEVVEAYSGEGCLEKIKEEKPDLILLDVMMPKIDGWEVLRRIKENEELKAIPVVMLTVKPLNAETLKRKEMGYLSDYVIKPFSKEDLIACVREVLGP